MNIDAMQLQTWLSILVVVAAGGIATFAIVLKLKNDKLRKTVAELILRQQASFHVAVPLAAPATEEPEHSVPPAAVLPADEPAALEPPDAPVAATMEVTTEVVDSPAPEEEAPASPDSEVRDRNIAIRRAQDRAIDFASRQGRRRHPGPRPESFLSLDEMNPREALSDWLNKRAAARAPQDTTSSSRPRLGSFTGENPAAAEPKLSSVVIDESLWESILGRSPAPKTPRFEVIQGTTKGLPAGLHDDAVLRRLIESNKTFQGLAVGIWAGMNDGSAVGRDLMSQIQQLVRSLLRGDEFACQTSDDEFLLLCPGQQGVEAESRLSEISQRLWDFQLRSAGSFSMLFSTGDVVVEGGSLSEAAAEASTRLQQACRARKMVSLDSASTRKAVSAAI